MAHFEVIWKESLTETRYLIVFKNKIRSLFTSYIYMYTHTQTHIAVINIFTYFVYKIIWCKPASFSMCIISFLTFGTIAFDTHDVYGFAAFFSLNYFIDR